MRIAGVNLPDNKVVMVALTSIYGIGKSSAVKILKTLSVEPLTKVKDLTAKNEEQIRSEISKFVVEGDLRARVYNNISLLKQIACYRGIRHAGKLPVRGQRTKSNARTRKGKKGTTVANKKVVAK